MSFFLRLWLWFNVRHGAHHPWRVAAVVIGIGLGAAVFTSVRLAVEASVASFTSSVDILTGKADWVIVAPGGRVPETLVPKLLGMSAIRTASPVISTYVSAPESREPFLLLGFDPVLDRPLRNWHLEQDAPSVLPKLDLIADSDTLLITEQLAKRLSVESRGTVILETVQKSRPFRIVGTLRGEGLALAESGMVALCDIATIQELLSIQGFVDRIDILLQPGTSPETVQAIRESLPEGCFLERPGETKESGKRLIRSYQLNLSVLSFVSLFVGMFLVYSLVALNATARHSEVAILRSIGASPSLVFALFLAEGVSLGILGWLLALPLGSLLVRDLLKAVSGTISLLFVRTTVEAVTVAPLEIVLSFLMTTAVCAIAAIQPALEARKVSPREAMTILETASSRGVGHRSLALMGALLIAACWPISMLPPFMGLPVPGYAATFVLFLGFSLLSPWFLRMLGTYLPPALRRIGGETAYLGGRYVRDAGPRIAISTGALITAVGLFVALVVMVHSFRSTVATWVSQSIRGDLFLGSKDGSINRYREPLPSTLVEWLHREARQEPIELSPYRRIPLLHEKVPYQLEAVDFELFLKHSRFLMAKGDLQTELPALSRGEGVIVSEVFANQTGLRTGDLYEATVAGATLKMPVLGVFRDYRTHGGVVHYSLPHFIRQTGDGSWSGVRIQFTGSLVDRDRVIERVRSGIIAFCGAHGLAVEVTTGELLRREILRIFDETFAVTTALLIIALVVATLGMATTLSVLVLERTKQLHTLLACGASRAQIRAMIVWEAVLMVFGGQCMGMVCGFFLSFLLIYVINKQSFGWTFVYGVDGASLALSVPLILAAALLAALPAAQLVFKRSPALVLRER
ncbi:MAG: ABC transporter permease [Syntrophobacteraceae bacterium]